MVEVTVSNLQILGAVDSLRAKLDAVIELVQNSGLPPTDSSEDAEEAPAGKKTRRTRAKSAYNVHMSEELARLKDQHPELGHRKRFAMAVASWKSRGGEVEEGEVEATSDGAAPNTA